jgi:hypothetical protein
MAFLGAMTWPMHSHVDGFPLSDYPMFSRPKDSQAVIHHVVGFSRDGMHRPMGPEQLGTDEIMQASQTAKLAIRDQRADDLCRRVAAKIVDDDDYADITKLQVRVDWYDAIAYWNGDRKPRRTILAAACPVGE